MSYPFDFAGEAFVARPSGALWWPARRTLIVADLHLGKSERLARRGGALLPPYETHETLGRLQAEIAALRPSKVISLGDAFDDDAAAGALDNVARQTLWAMARQCELVWVRGNHDPGDASSCLPGAWVAEIPGPPTLRHEAGEGPDISGHFHPVARLAGQRRRAFVVGADNLILPAFGAYTGGLLATDPAISRLVPSGIAICCVGQKLLPIPLIGARVNKLAK